MGTDSNNRAGSGAAYSRFAEEMDIDTDSVNLNVRSSHSLKAFHSLTACCCAHWRAIIITLVILISLGIGIIMGHFIASSCSVLSSPNGVGHNGVGLTNVTGRTNVTAVPNVTAKPTRPPPVPNSTEFYLGLIEGLIGDTSVLMENFRMFTLEAHYAGSSYNKQLAGKIKQKWEEYSFGVHSKSYNVLLSRPDPLKPNKMSTIDASSGVTSKQFTLDDKGDTDETLIQPFAVYAQNATIVGLPVYVNYASREDFHQLKNLTGIFIFGNICLARIGKLTLAEMAYQCRRELCAALIAFPDPEHFRPRGSQPSSYSSKWWLPEKDMLRDTMRNGMGDPTTPFYPSQDWVYRDPYSLEMFAYPVQPISLTDAVLLLNDMKSPPTFPKWNMGRENIHAGPGFLDPTQMLNLELNNANSLVDITNIIGTIQGSVELDRYVIIGNHRDSFAYGAISPGTGTVCLLEVAKVLSELVRKGWKPRRTIILASWDAGEDGSVGSTEWVEENLEQLQSRAVAYINLDDAVSGTFSFAAAGSPLLTKAVFGATNSVPCPDESHSNMTVYKNWAANRPINPSLAKPQLDPLGTSSDSGPFLLLAGVPAVDLQYIYEKDNLAKYPTYRTESDRSTLILSQIDPNFDIHKAVTRVATELVVRLADSPKLPMDVRDYGDTLVRYLAQLRTDYGGKLAAQGILLDRLAIVVANFSTAAETFQGQFDALDETDVLAVREMNDHVLAVERAFLVLIGSSQNVEARHVIYDASTTTPNAGMGFGRIAHSVGLARELGWGMVQGSVDFTTLALQSATDLLADAQLH